MSETMTTSEVAYVPLVDLDARLADLNAARRALPLTRRAEFDAYMLGALSVTATTRAWASALGIARQSAGVGS